VITWYSWFTVIPWYSWLIENTSKLWYHLPCYHSLNVFSVNHEYHGITVEMYSLSIMSTMVSQFICILCQSWVQWYHSLHVFYQSWVPWYHSLNVFCQSWVPWYHSLNVFSQSWVPWYHSLNVFSVNHEYHGITV
jgi:hypothetical protein